MKTFATFLVFFFAAQAAISAELICDRTDGSKWRGASHRILQNGGDLTISINGVVPIGRNGTYEDASYTLTATEKFIDGGTAGRLRTYFAAAPRASSLFSVPVYISQDFRFAYLSSDLLGTSIYCEPKR